MKNIRTVVIPQHDEQTYTTEWTYDTWNRLTSMTYADGEKVEYKYNAGGLLRSMTGKKKGSSYAYVNQLGYDKFEQRVYLEYGNGTKTTYDYEPDRKRRLHSMTAQTTAKRLFMDNVYGYDKVNNIKTLVNKAPIPSSNLMGGASSYSYDYDDLYRLTTAEGSYKGSNEEHTYTLSMDYNSVGGITQKNQVHKKKDNIQKKTTYDLAYAYGETQPHAPIHIGDQTYTYDANGNQTGWTSDVSGQERRILWDEENRIRSIYDNGSQHHYIYDAAGERVIKGKSTGQRIFVNGEWKAGSGQMGNYTVYVNPYLVLKSGGYTKHYYIEGQRIVSKLGGGWDNSGKGPLKAGSNKVDYVGKTQKVFDGIVKNLKFLGSDGQILTAGKSGKIPPGQLNGKGTGNVTEAFRYFYHPDHLGSTSYVTDASGEVYQHLEYFAFGETFVEEHSNTDRTPYLFNGKELDEETGLYYYGARYYDARTSVWQSVDPLAEKMSNWSPYNYAFNNPLTLTDPDGKEPEPFVYKIHVRSFISTEYTKDPLGRKYHGDNRGPSTGDDVTARGRATLSYNSNSNEVTLSGKPFANETVREDFFGGTSKKTGEVTYNSNSYNHGSKKVIDLLYSTYNPLTPESLTPAVDVNSRFVINHDKKNNTLDVAFTVRADGYPSTESFIEDNTGARILLGAKKEEGSPGSRLNGGAEKLRFTGKISIGLDSGGNFSNVTVGSGQDKKTYSIDDWNKKVQSDF